MISREIVESTRNSSVGDIASMIHELALESTSPELLLEASYRIQLLGHILNEAREYLRFDREITDAAAECDWHASLLIEIDNAIGKEVMPSDSADLPIGS